MAREYRHIEEYETEILAMWDRGATKREIADRFGMSKEQIKGFLKRHRKKEKKLAAGMELRKKGRPQKNNLAQTDDQIAELRYILARKEARIKTLEMENELMRDFLSLIERK